MAETIKVLVSEEEVDARIEALGKQISEDYAGKQVQIGRASCRERVSSPV